jgi:adenylate kinase family enzyme
VRAAAFLANPAVGLGGASASGWWCRAATQSLDPDVNKSQGQAVCFHSGYRMRRIMIVGGPGAGKSTVGLALGPALGLPVHHLDHIYWGPQWATLSETERQAAVAGVLALPGYVLEGGSPATYAARLADCDTVIWLDLNPALRLIRILLRVLRTRGRARPDLPPESPEDHPVHRRRFWRHLAQNLPQEQAVLQALVAKAGPGTRVIRLRSRREVRAFLQTCGARVKIIVPEK